MSYYNRAFSVAVEIMPHYINFSGGYTAQVFNDEEHARRTGYRPTPYRDQYGYMIWEYVPEWLGIERKYYNLDYAVVLPICGGFVMIVLWINGKRGFTPCKFILTDSGEVFVDHPGDGFYKHPTFDRAALEKHLIKLLCEGFSIDNVSNEAKTYAGKIKGATL